MTPDLVAGRRSQFKTRYRGTPADSTLQLLEIVGEEARLDGQTFVRISHLLGGLARIPETRPVLLRFNVDIAQIRAQTAGSEARGHTLLKTEPALSPLVDQVIRHGVREAKEAGNTRVEPHHIGLAMVRKASVIANGLFESLRIPTHQFEAALLEERSARISEHIVNPSNAASNLVALRRIVADPGTSKEELDLIGQDLAAIIEKLKRERSNRKKP